MKNETFREIGFWGSLCSAVISLINFIIYLVKGIKLFNTELDGSIMNVLTYPAEHCVETLLYKIGLVIWAISALSMLISFLINTNGALKVIMIITKIIQALCIAAAAIGYFSMHSLTVIYLAALVFAAVELIVLILYIINRDHRKTILRVIVFSIFAVGSGGAFFLLEMLLVACVAFMILIFTPLLFLHPEKKTAIVDMNGKIIGWLKRE